MVQPCWGQQGTGSRAAAQKGRERDISHLRLQAQLLPGAPRQGAGGLRQHANRQRVAAPQAVGMHHAAPALAGALGCGQVGGAQAGQHLRQQVVSCRAGQAGRRAQREVAGEALAGGRSAAGGWQRREALLAGLSGHFPQGRKGNSVAGGLT